MRRILIYLSLIWISSAGLAHAQSAGKSWVMIDVAKQTLSILQGDQIKHIFRNISVGRNGYTLDRHEGDGKTPLGVFHVAWINPNSRFHLFFGLDYPNRQSSASGHPFRRQHRHSRHRSRQSLYP
jgi:murein L,D-transpeptidase YafK